MMTAKKKPLVEVRNLEKHFPIHSGVFRRVVGHNHAVDNLSLAIAAGETLGLVGESGCGKTTTGRLILRLLEPTSGTVWFEGKNLRELSARAMREARRDMQIIFQDPISSLHPRMRVNEIIGEPIRIHRLLSSKSAVQQRVKDLMAVVGLPVDYLSRYPHELSGGQCQRVGIARALALNPKLVVCDEPVSALDVSIQGQILNLLIELQQQFDLTYLFIAHDLSLVRQISDRVVVMYSGRIVEIAGSRQIFDKPFHPYTDALISAIPIPDPQVKREQTILKGEIPSGVDVPAGCAFHTRCPYAIERCRTEIPMLRSPRGMDESERKVACHRAEELDLAGVTSIEVHSSPRSI